MPATPAPQAAGLSAPALGAAAITPSDAGSLPEPTRAVYVGAGGDLRVRMLSGEIVTLGGVLGGTIYPLRVAQVLATGTTATGLVGLR